MALTLHIVFDSATFELCRGLYVLFFLRIKITKVANPRGYLAIVEGLAEPETVPEDLVGPIPSPSKM